MISSYSGFTLCHFPYFSSRALICREKAIICTKLHLCNFENEFSTLPVVFQLHFSFCLDFMVTSRSHTCLFSPSSNHPLSTVKKTQLLEGSCGCLQSFVCLSGSLYIYEYACIRVPDWSHTMKSWYATIQNYKKSLYF